MHTIRPLVICILFITLSWFKLCAQQAILPSGADVNGLGGTVSYSIGQLDYINFSADSGLVSLGVQQPLVVKMVGTDDPKENVNITAFPNPVDNAINLKLEEGLFNSSKNHLSYSLYDISGKLQVQKKIDRVSTLISMEKYGSGIYLLQVILNNAEARSFKIIKTN